jgi:hypothetical protein
MEPQKRSGYLNHTNIREKSTWCWGKRAQSIGDEGETITLSRGPDTLHGGTLMALRERKR